MSKLKDKFIELCNHIDLWGQFLNGSRLGYNLSLTADTDCKALCNVSEEWERDLKLTLLGGKELDSRGVAIGVRTRGEKEDNNFEYAPFRQDALLEAIYNIKLNGEDILFIRRDFDDKLPKESVLGNNPNILYLMFFTDVSGVLHCNINVSMCDTNELLRLFYIYSHLLEVVACLSGKQIGKLSIECVILKLPPKEKRLELNAEVSDDRCIGIKTIEELADILSATEE